MPTALVRSFFSQCPCPPIHVESRVAVHLHHLSSEVPAGALCFPHQQRPPAISRTTHPNSSRTHHPGEIIRRYLCVCELRDNLACLYTHDGHDRVTRTHALRDVDSEHIVFRLIQPSVCQRCPDTPRAALGHNDRGQRLLDENRRDRLRVHVLPEVYGSRYFGLFTKEPLVFFQYLSVKVHVSRPDMIHVNLLSHLLFVSDGLLMIVPWASDFPLAGVVVEFRIASYAFLRVFPPRQHEDLDLTRHTPLSIRSARPPRRRIGQKSRRHITESSLDLTTIFHLGHLVE